MKRTIPLLITALSGFVLIFAYFIPATQSWGEVVSIWFDILAAIAFVLGGGNLLKVQLKKISDRKAGWGYAAVTVIAFGITLLIGLLKVGVTPATNQEFKGESFAALPVAALPEYSVPGELPDKVREQALPASVRAQLRAADGRLFFRGWLRPNQVHDLLAYDSRLEWRAGVERLAAAAAPPAALRGVLNYYYEHDALAFLGAMSAEHETALRAAVPDSAAASAIDQLKIAARRETSAPIESVPPNLQIPAEKQASLRLQEQQRVVNSTEGWIVRRSTALRLQEQRLIVQGPLTPADRNRLERRWAGFPIARRLDDFQQVPLLAEINANGRPLNSTQVQTLNRVLNATWTAEELRDLLNTAGQSQPSPKTNEQLRAERNAGATDLQPLLLAGESLTINAEQFAALERFEIDADFSGDALIEALRAAGPLSSAQEGALRAKFDELPTVGERNYALAVELLKFGQLRNRQIDLLLADYRNEHRWRRDVARLAAASHVVKYPWSGEYGQQGSAFWWMYEFVFQPLTATMFALLAFYVASAAFRAFRAKNLEAILLLGTAFIILLGRTFAGVLLTSRLPESLSGLRIENLTIEIMSVFATAGNRAIMIGIALGIAATSLRVLLGVDRSHLGGGDE